jgi:hypothetical protein
MSSLKRSGVACSQAYVGGGGSWLGASFASRGGRVEREFCVRGVVVRVVTRGEVGDEVGRDDGIRGRRRGRAFTARGQRA